MHCCEGSADKSSSSLLHWEYFDTVQCNSTLNCNAFHRLHCNVFNASHCNALLIGKCWQVGQQTFCPQGRDCFCPLTVLDLNIIIFVIIIMVIIVIIIIIIITRPWPVFGRLGLGGLWGGYSSHGYPSHASLRAFGAQLEGCQGGPLRCETVTNGVP